jgi:hypothetical protein
MAAEHVTCWCECIASEKITQTLAALLSTCNSTPAMNTGILGGPTPVILRFDISTGMK